MPKCPNCSQPYNPGEEVCSSCGLVFPFTTDTIASGTLLQGRYEIERLYHAGGMGYVYLARDKKLYDRTCIVKQVKEPVRNEVDQKKLEEEALRMSRLNHPGIAMILDHFIEGGYYYLVVERIQGKTLSEVFAERQGRLTEEEVVKWAIAMCEVVEYIHREGVIHRDISPDNVMLTEDGHIKFIDFGTLREFRHIAVQGTAGMGKYGYTPPEQWQGKPVAQSDIFALGATIYYLLSGNLPLSREYKSGQGPQKTDFRPEFAPIRTKNPAISPQLEAVLQRALQLEANTRYSSAMEMWRALSELGEAGNPTEQAVGTTRNIPDQKLATTYKPIGPVPTKSGHKKWILLPSSIVIGLAVVVSIIMVVNQVRNASENETPLGQGLTVTNGPVPEPGERKPLWQFDYRANYGYASEPIVADNQVFFVADGMIYCLDAINGNLVRKYSAPLDSNSSDPLKQYHSYELIGIYESRLLVECDYSIYCIDAEKGKTLWFFEYGGDPVLQGDRLYFYNTELWRNGSFISVDVNTGNTLWKKCVWDKFTEIEGGDIGTYDIVVDNYQVYFMYGDMDFSSSQNIGTACLDKNSGQLIWKNSSNIKGSDGAISSIIVADDKVVEAISFYDGKSNQVLLICLDAATGKELWRTDKFDWHHRNMAIDRGKLIECHDEGIVCFDADSGRIVWQHQESGRGLLTLGDTVIIPNVGGTKTCYFDLNSGKMINQYGLFLYNPVIAANRIFDNAGKSIRSYYLN